MSRPAPSSDTSAQAQALLSQPISSLEAQHAQLHSAMATAQRAMASLDSTDMPAAITKYLAQLAELHQLESVLAQKRAALPPVGRAEAEVALFEHIADTFAAEGEKVRALQAEIANLKAQLVSAMELSAAASAAPSAAPSAALPATLLDVFAAVHRTVVSNSLVLERHVLEMDAFASVEDYARKVGAHRSTGQPWSSVMHDKFKLSRGNHTRTVQAVQREYDELKAEMERGKQEITQAMEPLRRYLRGGPPVGNKAGTETHNKRARQ